MSQADAEGAAAALTRCFGEPGFAQVCVRKVLEEVPDAKALFLEMPLAAATMTTKLMEQTADRPPEQRFRPFVARIRALKADDVAKAVSAEPAALGAFPALVKLAEGAPITSERYAVVCGVILPPASAGGRADVSLVTVSRVVGQAEGQAAEVVSEGSFSAKPSLWVANAQPVKRVAEETNAAPAEGGAGQDEWLYCTHKGKGRSRKRPIFQWTGKLRPHPISPFRQVPKGIARPDYATTGWPAAEMESKQQQIIPVYSQKDIEGIRAACRLGRKVLDACVAAVKPGVTTDELDKICHEVTVGGGAYPSPLNYCHFPKSCCTSVNEVICHGIPDQRKLEDGDIVNLDISVFLNGYHADLNETVLVGNVDDAGRHLVKSSLECLEHATAIVKPGTRFRDVGDVISKHASANGLSVVRTYCGHGIGEHFHCAPSIPHYANNKAVGVMKPGMVFTIEPMINAGTWRDTTWPDGWTSVTQDGKRSAQFEHTLLVTETGVEVLTARTQESPTVFPFAAASS